MEGFNEDRVNDFESASRNFLLVFGGLASEIKFVGAPTSHYERFGGLKMQDLVDVLSDIFFCSGEGKGKFEAPGEGGG